jgi:hypothetical protein
MNATLAIMSILLNGESTLLSARLAIQEFGKGVANGLLADLKTFEMRSQSPSLHPTPFPRRLLVP